MRLRPVFVPRRAPDEQFDSIQANIPCGWWLSSEDVSRIVRTVNDFNPK